MIRNKRSSTELARINMEYFDEIECPLINDSDKRCGNKLFLRQQKFCAECGGKVDLAWFQKPSEPPDSELCQGLDDDGSVCGAQLDSAARFCPNCGTRNPKRARPSMSNTGQAAAPVLAASSTQVMDVDADLSSTKAARESASVGTSGEPAVQPDESVQIPVTPVSSTRSENIDSKLEQSVESAGSSKLDSDNSEFIGESSQDASTYFTPPSDLKKPRYFPPLPGCEPDSSEVGSPDRQEPMTDTVSAQTVNDDKASPVSVQEDQDTRQPEKTDDSENSSHQMGDSSHTQNVDTLQTAESELRRDGVDRKTDGEDSVTKSDMKSDRCSDTAKQQKAANQGDSLDSEHLTVAESDNENPENPLGVKIEAKNNSESFLQSPQISKQRPEIPKQAASDGNKPSSSDSHPLTPISSDESASAVEVMDSHDVKTDEDKMDESDVASSPASKTEKRKRESRKPTDENKPSSAKPKSDSDPLTATSQKESTSVIETEDSRDANADDDTRSSRPPKAEKRKRELRKPTDENKSSEAKPGSASDPLTVINTEDSRAAKADKDVKSPQHSKTVRQKQELPKSGEGKPSPSAMSSTDSHSPAPSSGKESTSGGADHPGYVVYKKNDTIPENYVNPANNKPDKRLTRAAAASAKRTITVHFHVVLPVAEFSFKQNHGDVVLMRFSQASRLDRQGGWKDDGYKMKLEKSIDDKFLLMQLDVDVEKDVAVSYSKVEYKYAVKHGDGKVTYEFIPWKKTDGTDGNIANRNFCVPSDRIQQATEWHQYDGIMTNKPGEGDGWLTRLSKWTGKYYDKIMKQNKMAAMAMMPSWLDLSSEQEERRAERFLEKFDQVCYCVSNCFVTEDVRPDESLMKPALSEFIEPAVKELNENASKDETKAEGGVRLAKACCIIYVIQQYRLPFKDMASTLMTALLLKPDKTTQHCSDYDQLVSIHLTTDLWRKKIGGSLLNFMHRITRDRPVEARWLLGVPLLHFLTGTVKPFSRVDVVANHTSQDWWGISEMSKLVETFKYTQKSSMPVQVYLEKLGPLFDLDRMLPRTLLSVMSLQHLSALYGSMIVPPDACMANLCYFVKTDFIEEKVVVPLLRTLIELIINWTQGLNTTCSPQQLKEQFADLQVHHKIALDLYHEVRVRNEFLNRRQPVITALQLVAATISNLQKLYGVAMQTDISNDDKERWKQMIHTYVDDMSGILNLWLGKVLNVTIAYSSYGRLYYTGDEIQIYDQLLQITFCDADATEQWKKIIIHSIRHRLMMVDDRLRVYLFCDIDFSKLCREMEDSFSAAAFEVLENSAKSRDGNFDFVFNAASNNPSALKIRKLLSTMFENAWPDQHVDENAILHHIITWPSFHRFLSLFYGKSERAGLLSDKCQECIASGLGILETTIQALLTGNITVRQLQMLSEGFRNFLEVFRVVEKNSESGMVNVPESGIKGVEKVHVLQKVLSWRQTERSSLENMCNLVRHFADRCHDVPSDDIGLLRQKTDESQDDMQISSFCKPLSYSAAAANVPDYKPTVTGFGLSTEVCNMLVRLYALRGSAIFRNMWTGHCKRLISNLEPGRRLSVVEIEQSIWQPANKSFMQFCDGVVAGAVIFKAVDLFFTSVFGQRYDALRKELEIICAGDNSVIDTRLNQVRQYHQLDIYSQGAEAMLKLRNLFKLTGDFKDVEILVDLVKDKSKSLQCITKELIESGKKLQEVNDRKVKCLDVLIKNKKFADWLRESLKGPKEVKVLVDLAMISAEGQGDLEVQKVSCLHAAATGYAPLIYDFKPNMGFKEFLPLCQAVWRAVEVDEQLPEKFKDTARQLDWLKRVKESHGSVEVNALANARAINEKGVYSVGNLTSNNKSGENEHRKCLDTVVQLKLKLEKGDTELEDGVDLRREQIEKEKWQTLNLQQLNDLQSKLMLVAGKALEGKEQGKEQVDTFVAILDGVTRLGNLYVQICNAGCTLFQNWKAVFYCQPRGGTCTIVKFGKDGKHKLYGKRSEVSNGVVEHISSLCKFMEDCLKEWKHHIEEQRTKSYYLNHFTTEQLVILQSELAKISTEKGLSKVVYPMLSVVRRNCTLKDLEVALCSAFKKGSEEEQKPSISSPQDDVIDDMEEENLKMEMQKEMEAAFLKSMQDNGFSIKLAFKALKEVGADIEEGSMWCLAHEYDDDDDDVDKMEEDLDDDNLGDHLESKQPKDFNPDWRKHISTYKGLQLETTKDSLTTDIFHSVNKIKGSLLESLEELWKVYESEMNTTVSDYLSLFHLGSLLEHLADVTDLQRPWPSYLKKGRPNLVVCSQPEVLGVVLSTYLYENGTNIKLPGTDEVLVCNSNTSYEDVELLWRRAEGDARKHRHGKIYTLVHAEQLDYEISRKVEESLEKHSHAVDDMHLIVVCCRELEDRCHMINALDRYRVKLSPIDPSDVQLYLKQHFTVGNVPGYSRPAASLDPEKCCVRVIKSHRAGVGKTLKVNRLHERLREITGKSTYQGPLLISIPLHCRTVDQSAILKTLLDHTLEPQKCIPRIFHIDIAHEVLDGVDYLLFNLLVLGSITDREGYVWTRSPADLYVIETMPLLQKGSARTSDKRVLQQQHAQELQYVHHIFHILPTLTCWSPMDSLNIARNNLVALRTHYTNAVVNKTLDQVMDDSEFRSAMFQRPFQYLQRYDHREELRGIQSDTPFGTAELCINTLLQHCGIENPSWSELKHFVNFLNVQLRACENSVFCSAFLAPDLPGFLNFVVRFMMQMSKDFATRSLQISEETPEVAMELLNLQDEDGNDVQNVLEHYGLKRRWETSPHPYLFFNDDHNSFTFMGFIVNPQTGDILDPRTQEILTPQAVPRQLYDALIRNGVNLSENFDLLPRLEKIKKMCNVLGVDIVYDPDPTYELTADNVKKMLAIYMRFRCNIPVIVMGETGCGKTRLIKFMCDLWKPPGAEVTNMILMKVHGGTTAADIVRKVEVAVNHAQQNMLEFPDMQTILFFDEANTTEDIGLIKEIMCDHTIRGRPLMETHGLKLIAACNPYRKHSDEMIQRLEHAGLGYHIEANQTTDKLGRIPMRHLVYRVQSLPQSLLPLVWDFGQLSPDVEELYIRQMVYRYVSEVDELNINFQQLVETISLILAASQEFMRKQKDECSFVSLRDVDRTLQVMMWFYHHKTVLFNLIDNKAIDELREQMADDDDDGDEDPPFKPPNDITRSLMLALGVCYHACLEKRRQYREFVGRYFVGPCDVTNAEESLRENISWCQDVFLDGVELGPNIARNQALKENVFMMVVCIELRIPLFLVGKPGSSKSLAKTIVADAMQGEAAHTDLFRTLKSVHMVSYQCSPLSTPEGIVGTFRQCAKLQQNQDLNKFVSVVVLDEVGLAEDSPRMPLKTLHPLLEDGCEGDEEPAPHKKVGFIGISNWALDPAKMNRGILVQRGVPDEPELEQSAKGICASGEDVAGRIESLIRPMAKAYLELYNSALKIREFFGLRDFYSLVKMVYGFASRSGNMPTWYELQHAILRNFGGLDDVEPIKVFARHIKSVNRDAPREMSDPACDPASLIRASLAGDNHGDTDLDSETRYLLILTENYAALGILQQELLKIKDAIIIFGSSFPKDQEYTQVCRNINRIKVCMETGQTVVLLNLENLYESLYDALNQYYIKFGDQRFVDLGLGTQRVKCRVHLNFRLIVVAEKKIVYEKFPIPLINRLEKHFLAMDTMLTRDQRDLTRRLQQWAEDCCETQLTHAHTPKSGRRPKVGDMFIGYHADTAASIILQVCNSQSADDIQNDESAQILDEAKKLLLRCATPESIVRLNKSRLAASAAEIERIYFKEQQHENIMQFVEHNFVANKPTDSVFVQVTTHSRLLLVADALNIAKLMGLKKDCVVVQSLQAFDTEQQFCKMLKDMFGGKSSTTRLLILQCDSGDVHADLIACARYNIANEFGQPLVTDDAERTVQVHVLFIIQLPRIAGGCFVGFQGGRWTCHHIDDLHPAQDYLPSLTTLQENSVSSLFEKALNVGGTSAGTSQSDIVVEEDMDVTETTEEEPMNVNDIEVVVDFNHQMDILQTVTTARKRDAQKAIELGRMALEGRGVGCEKLDVEGIVRSCLHPAAAMLRDKENCRERKTTRLRLLLDLLSPNSNIAKQDEKSLMGVLMQRIALLLRDKEDTAMSAIAANSWLSDEATSFQAISRAGTFRKALSQYLESRVAPLLAGILSFADTNCNLDILDLTARDAGRSLQWLSDMWLSMLSDSDITALKYRDLQSATQRLELTEFEVKMTGPSTFASRLPFSWIIKERVDLMIFNAKQQMKENTQTLVERLLKASPLGAVLDRAMQAAGTPAEISERYLHDYVHMVYEPMSKHPDDEYALVIADLKFEAEQQLMNGRASDADEAEAHEKLFVDTTDNNSLSIPAIHIIFDTIHRRICLFQRLAQVWPECVPMMAKGQHSLPLDLKSLVLLTESLTPVKDALDNANSRQDWCNRVQMLSPVVSHLLESVGMITLVSLMTWKERCRCMWNRVCALQLFIQHVCPPGTKEQLSVRRCMPLWTMLGETADFRTDKSLGTIEGFLKICHKAASELHFGKVQCPWCDQPIDSPVKLPCSHVLCLKCVVELKELDLRQCPNKICQKDFRKDFNATVISDKKAAAEEHNRYKQRCNAFFMDLVSRLCFGDAGPDSIPPEPGVVHRLMGYITCQSRVAEKLKELRGTVPQKTKKMFDEAIDPTPVVRSFLLQLLLRSDVNQVREYLQEFFDNAQLLLHTDQQHVMELCLLCVQCLEDHYHTMCIQSDSVLQQIYFTKKLLKESWETFCHPEGKELNIWTLEAVAKARYGLLVCAQWIYRLFVVRDVEQELRLDAKKLCDMAASLCDPQTVKWPRLYLMKQIMRQYGMDILKQASNVREVRWLAPHDNQNEVVPDRFIVCGDSYKQLRELMAEIVLGKDVNTISELIQTMTDKQEVRERNLLLAIYREVTANAGRVNFQAPPQTLQQLSQFCQGCQLLKDKPLAVALTNNTIAANMLQVTAGQSPADRALAEAVIHFKIVMNALRGNAVAQPLLSLIYNDGAMTNAFLPTMPQDDLADVKAAVHGVGENPTFYQCANGHPYVIGNCGRPVVADTCRQCGQRIGGQGYVLEPTNQAITITDNTRPGHILGAPQRRDPVPERQMTAASSSVLRLLLHMSMFLGATENPQVVSAIIAPPIAPLNVVNFLWQHMVCDVDTIHTALSRSLDDVIVLVHLLLSHALTIGRVDYNGDVHLTSKQARQQWENAFVNQFITPILADVNNRLQHANNEMVNDKRLGNNPLLRMLYEVDTDAKLTTDQILEVPTLWRYRARVSLEHMKHELEERRGTGRGKTKVSPYPVLDLFLKEELHLRALRLLPNIMQLHRQLLARLNRSIDHAEATSLKISTFLESIHEDNIRRNLESLIKDFCTAWDSVRQNLVTYAFGGRRLPPEYAQSPIDDQSCLAVLLPSLRGYGLCSVALTYFLFEKQNDFLEKYCKLTKQKLDANGVDMRDAGNAHLVSFHPERDLQPIILANCNYSLELGKGTRIEYDFATMEKQFEERFIRGRPRLHYQIDFVLFREDFTNAAVFAELRSRIPQEQLSNASVFEKELHQKLADVNDLLASLDITVGFLVSVAGDPNASLVRFMTDTLQMKPRPQLLAVIQSCKLKHVEDLWLILSYMRSRLQANYGQDPFDNVEDKYREKVPDDLVQKLKVALQHINLDLFLPKLHECILFQITVKQDTTQEDYVDNVDQPLNYVLDGYLEHKGLNNAIPALTDGRFPSEVKVKHCIDTWRMALRPVRQLR